MKKRIIVGLVLCNLGVFFLGTYYTNHQEKEAKAIDVNSDLEMPELDSTDEIISETETKIETLSDGRNIWLEEYIDDSNLIVNKTIGLPETYRPDDLVEVNVPFVNNLDERNKLREEAANALEEMFQGARRDGIYLVGVSGYRSYEKQQRIYETSLKEKGITHTNKYVALPGTSEHQLGLAIDISSKRLNYKLVNSFASTKEGIWLKENCYKYGFITRYPDNKEDIVGYAYEPWHFRYVGIDLASELTEGNLTLEEYFMELEVEN